MKKVRAAPRGEGPQLFIADQIAEGAVAFLKTEYTYLLPFVVICAAFIVGILEGQSGSPVGLLRQQGRVANYRVLLVRRVFVRVGRLDGHEDCDGNER
jgi:hypothetical protein